MDVVVIGEAFLALFFLYHKLLAPQNVLMTFKGGVKLSDLLR